MTQLQMQRAAKIAGAQTRAIALYRTDHLTLPQLSPLLFAAAFSGLLWPLAFARLLHIFA